MSLKDAAIQEVKGLIRDFGISPSRLSRDLFNDPSFCARLMEGNARVTDVTLDRIFQYAVEMRGQVSMTLIVGKKERRKR